ncbi:hypothetical protein GPX89_30115 [Nocardia sp. ET3-3]|uniref:Uncharacterized protein n=1 Tax=Nocardia terrae TaxID=2675851 RepID=A0A7K1V4R9_9NOCA|nr:hypothetical protein [Nocardia terrae]MVU81482.1 hypothetical protein [Nocardia terrae]
MTNSTVSIDLFPTGWCIIPKAPLGPVESSGAEEMVLEVVGGVLVWDVFDDRRLPFAMISDIDIAQDWVWAVYGETVALTLDEMSRIDSAISSASDVAAAPALPALVVSARRLAYAHWASRWWPASTLDGIAALDPVLLDRDIAVLTAECESLVDGSDAIVPLAPTYIENPPRASDYALAAGDEHRAADAFVLARGTGGWDWQRCPPGLVDASESAVSWQLVRDRGATKVSITVAAHPDLPADIPTHLRVWADVDLGGDGLEIELRAVADTWIGESPLPAPASTVRIAIHVPGFGPMPLPREFRWGDMERSGDAARAVLRQRIRDYAASRLHYATTSTADDDPVAPLLAEIAAATGDSDF